MTRLSSTLCMSVLWPAWGLAHEGHGMEGPSHYHASDVWGFVALLGVAALVWWLGRGK